MTSACRDRRRATPEVTYQFVHTTARSLRPGRTGAKGDQGGQGGRQLAGAYTGCSLFGRSKAALDPINLIVELRVHVVDLLRLLVPVWTEPTCPPGHFELVHQYDEQARPHGQVWSLPLTKLPARRAPRDLRL
ncbi:MAG: hypothetical protein ABSE77_13715 [Acidimicrobiales bacterium]